MTDIAILGLGTVGSGTADLLTSHKELIDARVGGVRIKYILDIRDLPDSPYHDLIVHDIGKIISDPDVSVVVEVIGGLHPAYEFTCRALEAGKSVVTSNKELVASAGDELLELARAHDAVYLFEASVGGGVPIIHPLMTDLAANEIRAISGIMNGTTNYILTRMFRGGVDFDTALREAQSLGYAEANPAADVEGLDACRKICILAAVAFGKLVSPDSVHTEGITAIRTADVRAAKAFGAEIKLLGRAVRDGSGDLYMTVAPFFVSTDNPLSHVDDVYNAILVNGSAVGDVMFYGRGAGAAPTASAVAADILTIAGGHTSGCVPAFTKTDELPADFGFYSCRHFISMSNTDAVAAHVIFGDCTTLPDSGDELWIVTDEMTENAFAGSAARMISSGATILSHIRIYH